MSPPTRLNNRPSRRDASSLSYAFCRANVHQGISPALSYPAHLLNACKTFFQYQYPYVKVKGRWCYLYRVMDQEGSLVDSRLSEQRDMAAAKAFFAQARDLAGTPERVTADGHTSYPRAIAEVLGPQVEQARVSCRANPIEQDPRGLKQRYYPMLGFKAFAAAQRFCRALKKVRQCLRPRLRLGQFVSLAQRRAHVLARVAELHSLFAPA